MIGAVVMPGSCAMFSPPPISPPSSLLAAIREFSKDAFHPTGKVGFSLTQEDPSHRYEMPADGIGILSTGHED